MKYGFDLDDTLADTANVINKYAKKFDIEFLNGDGEFKKEVGYNKDYYYFADALDWEKNDIKRFFEVYYLNILKETTVKSGIKDFFKTLKDRGNEIYIISSRRTKENEDIEQITKEWLNKNNIIYDKLFINIKNKSEIVNRYDINIFVDDSYNYCKEVSDLTEAKVFMIQNIYNEKIQDESIAKVIKIEEIIDG